MTSPKISVVVTAFNSELYLYEALKSVVRQEFSDYEVFVIDDGSKTRMAGYICRQIEAESGIEIGYHYKENGGPSSARNVGLSLATGEFLAFLDADDMFTEQKLSIQYHMLKKLPAEYACVIGSVEKFKNGRRRISFQRSCPDPVNGRFDVDRFLSGTLKIEGTPGYLFRRGALEAVAGFNESLKNNEDFELLLRLNRLYNIKTHEDVVFRQRVRPDSLSKFCPIKALNGALSFAESVAEMCPDVSTEAISRNKQRAYFSAALRSVRNFKVRHYIWLVNKGFEIGPPPRGWRGMISYMIALPLGMFGTRPDEMERPRKADSSSGASVTHR